MILIEADRMRTDRDINELVRENVKRILKDRNMDTEDLGRLMGLPSEGSGARMLLRRQMTLKTVGRFAAALNVQPSELLEERVWHVYVAKEANG